MREELFHPRWKDGKPFARLRCIIGGAPAAPLLNPEGQDVHYPGPNREVSGLHWLSDTQLLSWSGSDLCLWDATTGEKLRWVELPGVEASAMCVLPDHQSVLLLCKKEILWCALDGSVLSRFKISGPGEISLSRDGAHLFFLTKEALRAWSLEERKLLWVKRCEAVSASAEREIVTIFFNQKIVQYKISTGEEGATYTLSKTERISESIRYGRMQSDGVTATLIESVSKTNVFGSDGVTYIDSLDVVQRVSGIPSGPTLLSYPVSEVSAWSEAKIIEGQGRWLFYTEKSVVYIEKNAAGKPTSIWRDLSYPYPRASAAMAPEKPCFAVGMGDGAIFIFDWAEGQTA